MKKTIAIDMDGVLADTAQQYVNYYRKKYNVRIDISQFNGRQEADYLPNGAVHEFLNTPGFFSTVPVISGAINAVKKLKEKYDIYIVSAAMEFPLSLSEKKAWLSQYFPFISWKQLVFCGDKHIINTDYMIDDYCKNLDPFKGKGILFSAGHNLSISHHTRANNWSEVLAILAEEDTSIESLGEENV